MSATPRRRPTGRKKDPAAGSGFAAEAAHELRTPLSAIKILAQAALLARDESDRRAALEALIEAVDRAARTTEQILTLSRVEALPTSLRGAARIRLDAIAGRLIGNLALLPGRPGERIEARLAPCEIVGVEFAVGALLRNLVENAIRHAGDGAPVRVTVVAEPDAMCAIVEDGGPGIPPAERERVFERFQRSGEDRPGWGIGLAIVRRVAQAHHARVELDRSELGGLRVRVRFPKVGAPAP